MKALIVMMMLLPSLSWAAPFVCIKGEVPAAYMGQAEEYTIELAAWEPPRWNPSCKALQKASTQLNITSVVFAGIGLGMACTGVGIPATLYLEGAALTTQALSIVVGNLPCDDSADQARIEAAARKIVCTEFAKQGMHCSFKP